MNGQTVTNKEYEEAMRTFIARATESNNMVQYNKYSVTVTVTVSIWAWTDTVSRRQSGE
jgi:hypothetical protein